MDANPKMEYVLGYWSNSDSRWEYVMDTQPDTIKIFPSVEECIQWMNDHRVPTDMRHNIGIFDYADWVEWGPNFDEVEINNYYNPAMEHGQLNYVAMFHMRPGCDLAGRWEHSGYYDIRRRQTPEWHQCSLCRKYEWLGWQVKDTRNNHQSRICDDCYEATFHKEGEQNG